MSDEAYMEMGGKRHYMKDMPRMKEASISSEGKTRTAKDIGESPEAKMIRRRQAEILAKRLKARK